MLRTLEGDLQEAEGGRAESYADVISFLKDIPRETLFPRAPTTRQKFSRSEFRAYKAVGRFLARQSLKDLALVMATEGSAPARSGAPP
jgi:hypothetical protein